MVFALILIFPHWIVDAAGFPARFWLLMSRSVSFHATFHLMDVKEYGVLEWAVIGLLVSTSTEEPRQHPILIDVFEA